MREIGIILIYLFIGSQCSVVRKIDNKNAEFSNDKSKENIIKNVKKQNLTNNNFYIVKAEIEILSNEGNIKVIGSIKHKSPEEYLITIKSLIGIEIYRIYISQDTILVNDRINKKLYYGSTGYFDDKYKMSTDIFPLIFGDYLADTTFINLDNKGFLNKKIEFDCKLKGMNIKYGVDNKYYKNIDAVLQSWNRDTKIEMKYEKFKKVESILIPFKIEILEQVRQIKVIMKVRKIDVLWNDKIEFIPGKKYESIRLK